MARQFLTAITADAVVIPYAATITINAAGGGHFRFTLTGNAVMAAPASPADGQKITLEVIQDAAGGRTLTWNAAFGFGTPGAPVLTVTAAKRDLIGFVYSASASQWLYAGVTPGL